MYKNKLKSGKWKRFSEDVKRRDNYKCVECGSDKYLHVHHKVYYENRNPWEYPIDVLETLCKSCHYSKHKDVDIKTFVAKDKKHYQSIKRNERAKYREINKKNNIYKRGMTAQEIHTIMLNKLKNNE